MKRVLCLLFIFLLGLSVVLGVSIMSFLARDELPKTLEEADFEVVIPPGTGSPGFGVFSFKAFNWKGVSWKNHLLIIKPEALRSRYALLFITGDYKIDNGLLEVFNTIAIQNGAYVVVLYDIPNQPLFNDYREDWLIAYTFSKFLETGDYEWPLLLPMVRSTITAMNMITDYAKKEGFEIEGFILSGASKRGWTTWLTAAFDNRVKAIAPIAFDNLNIKEQMKHQLEFWGAYSKSIAEYVNTGILNDLEDPKRIALLQYVDPYAYREHLDIPKLIIVGTNDPYWPVNAATLYFDGLPGEKGMVYAPNMGHGAEISRTVQAIGALFANLDEGASLPEIMATYSTNASETEIHIDISIKPKDWKISEVRLFFANSQIRDFRNARFDYIPLGKAENMAATFSIKGYTATYIEVVFQRKGRAVSISTPIRVFP
ncbi:hypothetical protein AT15_04935 [Kosmotoga arenicorallina S304]|uniref:PhoPQ-activated pathogenicity-like protein PqaA type n=1 Tax=Kosmotoga arenicorallina S304 TaxID=1453497 RepID=A0A176JWA7_9BACT|nr:PhoPQ-activated protein PqaA family protein [Kosmotoga arenicorallina]OAA27956.1 hypothetical protein AT15_04935 [Kosmotoga arenicorallina S304]